MKALRYHVHGGPEVLCWEDAPDPEPGPGEVLIRVEAAGVSFSDLMRRAGSYAIRELLPAGLGREAAGRVAALGPGVSDLAVGDAVVCSGHACQAELVAVPAVAAAPLPPGMSMVEGSAIPNSFVTAHHLLHVLRPIRPGERVLIHAAASGVGTAAVQLARYRGARVLATASSQAKLDLARRLGADECISYKQGDWVAEVMARSDGRGVDRVLDCVGGEVLSRSVEALAPGGVLISYGHASGAFPAFDPGTLVVKNLTVIGLHLGLPPWTPVSRGRALGEVLALIAAGKARPVLDRRFRIEEAARAHEHLAARLSLGKVVLLIGREAT